MEKVKNWVLSHKKNFILAILGAIAGYLYWYYVGCESGSCAITSVWYRTAIYGALMGWLLSDVSFKKEINNEVKEDK